MNREKRSQSTLTTSAEIDLEIDRLKKESLISTERSSTVEGPINTDQELIANENTFKSKSSSFSSVSTNYELATTSLDTASRFNDKIKHIENYSTIIETFARNMDSVFENVNSVCNDIYKITDLENGMTTPCEENQSLNGSVSDKKKGLNYLNIYFI